MARRIAAMLALALPLPAMAAPQAIDLPGGRLHPESVSVAPGGTAYVGSMTGGVLRVRLASGRVERFLAPGAGGSGALFGVYADARNRLLWTCSNDFSASGVTVPGADPGHVIKGFDLRDGTLRVTLPMPGEHPVCNDFAVLRDGSVLVTDTGAPRLLRWRPGAAALEVWLEEPRLGTGPTGGGIDGIAVDGAGQVYVNNVRSGELFRVAVDRAMRPGAVTKLETSRPLVSPDGMRWLRGTALLVAEGEGRIALVEVAGDRATVRTLADGIASPTGVDAGAGQAWYVQGQLGWLLSGGKRGTQPALPFRLTPVALPR